MKEHNVRSKIGAAIDERGYVRKWVAEKIGTTPSMLSQWCQNNEKDRAKSTPHVLYIMRLCKLLNCGIHDLFELIEED